MSKNWREIKKLVEYPQEGILSKELAKTENTNATLFCMAAGTELSEHTSAKEGTVYVIEGDGTFTLEGEAIKMAPGVVIFMKKGAPHALSAKENTAFLLVLSGK